MHNYTLPAQRARKSAPLRIAAMLLSALLLSLYVLTPGTTYAGKEGVFINDSVYFTLEDAALSTGAGTQTMRFEIMLNNGSEEAVDFNQYGIKVTSPSGGSYYAELSQKADALVLPYTAVPYYFVSNVPGGITADQLMVTIFGRSADGTYDIGSLSVANSDSYKEHAGQLLVNLSNVDAAAFPVNTFVSYKANQAYLAPQEGKWNVTLDLTVSPVDVQTVALPAALHYYLKDGSGKTIPMTASYAEGSTLSSGKTNHMLLTAAMESAPATDSLTLELSNDGSGTNTYGQLPLAGVFHQAVLGERVPYTLYGQEGVSIEVTKAEQQQQSGKRYALISAVVHNDGTRTLQTPALSGILVSPQQEISVNANTVTTPESYIAAGEMGLYRFAAELPDGVGSGMLQFVMTKVSSGTSGTSGTAASGSSSSGAGSTGSTGSGTTAGDSTKTNTGSSGAAIPVMVTDLEQGLSGSTGFGSAPVYELGSPLVIDSGSELIDPNLEVSVVELNGHTNAENGYQTVVAKFKFLNKSSDTLTLPTFDTQLTDENGTSYPGARQTTVLQQLIPNAAYVYSYSYLLPPSAIGPFKLSLLDSSNAAKYKISISDYQVKVAQTGADDPTAVEKTLSLYPFNVKIENWLVSTLYSGSTYSYRLKMGLDIQKAEQVIVDDSFSTLLFEVVDQRGRTLGSSSQTLQGTNKLISGEQTIDFSIKTNQFEYPLTVCIYEVIATSDGGTAKRLVATLQQ